MKALFSIYALLATPREGGLPGTPEWNEQLSQDWPRIKVLGRVVNEDGKMIALLGVVAAESLQQVKNFLGRSPYASLLRDTTISSFELEVGGGDLRP